jgi:preprotein translocase subunit SecB
MPRSAKLAVQREGYPITPTKLYLVESTFVDSLPPDEAPGGWDDELEVDTSLSLFRHSLRKITVALSVESAEDAPLEFAVVYACDFVMSEALEGEEIEQAWQDLAFDTAPSLLYPYIRAEISRLTSHSRGGLLVLPLQPLPVRRPAGFEFPGPPEDASQPELRPTSGGGEAHG